jgi:hypothetical protein
MSNKFRNFWKSEVVAKLDPMKDAVDNTVARNEAEKSSNSRIVKELKEVMKRFPDVSDEELCRLVANRCDESVANVKQILDTGNFN